MGIDNSHEKDIHAIAVWLGPNDGYNCYGPGRVDLVLGDTSCGSSFWPRVVDSYYNDYYDVGSSETAVLITVLAMLHNYLAVVQ